MQFRNALKSVTVSWNQMLGHIGIRIVQQRVMCGPSKSYCYLNIKIFETEMVYSSLVVYTAHTMPN